MNLIIDIGNTLTKVHVFDNNQEVAQHSTDFNHVTDVVQNVSKAYSIKACIVSSVKNNNEEILSALEKIGAHIIEFNHQTPLPIKNLYKTPETLGYDRLAAAVGGQVSFPGNPLLIFDLGTAMTLEFIDEKASYHGGNITPGMQMRFRALHEFTDRLPLLKAGEFDEHPGKTTHEAILKGVIQGMVHEINGYVLSYKKVHPGLKIILTGGDAAYFESILKNTIFVIPNLVAIGLNRILTYNATH